MLLSAVIDVADADIAYAPCHCALLRCCRDAQPLMARWHLQRAMICARVAMLPRDDARAAD